MTNIFPFCWVAQRSYSGTGLEIMIRETGELCSINAEVKKIKIWNDICGEVQQFQVPFFLWAKFWQVEFCTFMTKWVKL